MRLFFTTILLISFAHGQAFAEDIKQLNIATYQSFEDEDDFDTYETTSISEIKDPLEKYNRKIFVFNDTFDRYFLEHLAKAYREKLPKPIRNMVRNFLTNLSLPVSTVNSILQGKTENSLATFSHFLINSTVGIGGLFDVAGEKNIRYNHEDFGQTLGHYGVDSGIYIMIPFLGPSSTRDLGGLVVDKSINPVEFNLLEIGGETDLIGADYRFAIAAASGVDKRESLLDIIEDVRNDSFDFYATLRSAYIQKRNSEIKN
jgi:phospholipid-binding lipoprotein MlaA